MKGKFLFSVFLATCALAPAAFAQTDSTRVPSTPSITYGDVAARTTWDRIEGKPETATRWPSWEEIKERPLSFPPTSHNHDSRYIQKSGGGSIRGTLTLSDISGPLDSYYSNTLDIVHEGDGKNGDDIEITTFNNVGKQGAMIAGRRHRGTYAAPQEPVHGDDIMSVVGRAWSDAENKADDVARMELNVDTNARGGQVVFRTRDIENENLVQRMAIRESGNVGIATMNPAGRLHVNTNAYGDGDPQNVLITGKGRVGINITNPRGKLDINNPGSGDGIPGIYSRTDYEQQPDFLMHNHGIIAAENNLYFTTVRDGGIISFRNGGANAADSDEIVRFTGNGTVRATAFTQSSDKRLKEDFVEIDGALDQLSNIKGYQYSWKGDPESNAIGLVAQEVQEVFPEVVHEDENGYLSVDYPSLVAPLINAVNELRERDQAREAENEALHEVIADLRQELDELRSQMSTE